MWARMKKQSSQGCGVLLEKPTEAEGGELPRGQGELEPADTIH